MKHLKIFWIAILPFLMPLNACRSNSGGGKDQDPNVEQEETGEPTTPKPNKPGDKPVKEPTKTSSTGGGGIDVRKLSWGEARQSQSALFTYRLTLPQSVRSLEALAFHIELVEDAAQGKAPAFLLQDVQVALKDIPMAADLSRFRFSKVETAVRDADVSLLDGIFLPVAGLWVVKAKIEVDGQVDVIEFEIRAS